MFTEIRVFVLGDMDGNGKLNILDVQQLFLATLSGGLDTFHSALANFDQVGTANILDVQQLFMATLKM